ncbi:MAG: cytochrome c oxidase subunit II [Candidatus Eremiobacteraeota bacterium]|nr:cytochrome c oxidase subunit II [Candidatus Eremiobacteraeota bacterium]
MRSLLDPSSVQGIAMRGDWFVFMIAGTAVGIVVYAAIAWCLIAYRQRGTRNAEQFSGNTALELLYVAVPLLMVVGLFIFTALLERNIDRVDAHPAYRIAVTAFRWSWRFAYRGSAVESAGTPAEPPTLYLPLDRTTQIDLTSADVTHSFWIPDFLFKRDAIPGMTNTFDLTPTRTGTFPARCAQFCGLDHARMTFVLRVVPDEVFQRYLASGGRATP